MLGAKQLLCKYVAWQHHVPRAKARGADPKPLGSLETALVIC